jgi:PKD repeat protein
MTRKINIANRGLLTLAVACCIYFFTSHHANAQRITNTGTDITIQQDSKIYLGTYIHQDGLIDNSGELIVTDSLVNNFPTFGIFGDNLSHPSAGRVIFRGSGAQQISGLGMGVFFYNVTLDNTAATPFTLYRPLNVENELYLTSGNINLNARIIDLGSNGHLANEANSHRIYGTRGHIVATMNLTNFTGEISNFGLYLNAQTNNFGLTEIRRAHYPLSPFSTSGHVNRYYDFRPTNPDGSIVNNVGIEFFDIEKLPAHNIADYRVFHSFTDGFSWVKEKSVAADDPQFDFQAMAMDVKNFGGSSPALKRSLVTLSEGTCANPPVVELGPASSSLCEGTSLQLTGPAGQQAYIWKKDNVIISTATTRQLSVTDAGLYELQVIDGNGCDGFDNITINVKAKPVADFNVNNFACKGDATSFSDLSSSVDGSITYQWNFGDPSSTTDVSTQPSPNYSYSNSGSFNVTLQVTSSFSCISDVKTKSAIVNALPLANFSANEVCFGTVTTLSNTSSGGTNSAWDFGAGNTSADRNPQHTFAFVGSNPVTLLVTDPNTTCTQTITKDVIVNPIPIADFTATPLCEPNEINFDNASVISSGTIRYDWTFGDGELSITENATKTYLQAGTFSVSLEATSDKGCANTSVKDVNVSMPMPVFGNNVSTCGNQLVLNANQSGRFTGGTFLWSDNSTNETLTARSSGTYAVSIRMPNGCETTGSVRVTLNSAVTPALGSNIQSCGPYTIDAGFYPAASYAWSTGESSRTISVSESGTFSVQVTDQNGCVGNASVAVTINPIPVVDLGIDQLLCNGETTRLDAGTSGNSYAWSNGSTGRFLNAGASGTYTATVSNTFGCSSSDQVRITVLSPVAVNLGPDKLICAEAPVTLDAKVTNVLYAWGSSNGTVGSGRTIETNRPGTYWVTITNISNCTASDTIIVSETTNTLKAEFLSASEVQPGDTLRFINVSYPRPFDSVWDLGNGAKSTSEDAQTIYFQEGMYNVRLDVTNDVCSNYRVKPITVKRTANSGGRVNTGSQDEIVSLKAFPNPTVGELRVEVELSSNMKASVTILNMIGISFFTETEQADFIDRSFDLSSLVAGVYIVKVVTPGQTKFVRIFKK